MGRPRRVERPPPDHRSGAEPDRACRTGPYTDHGPQPFDTRGTGRCPPSRSWCAERARLRLRERRLVRACSPPPAARYADRNGRVRGLSQPLAHVRPRLLPARRAYVMHLTRAGLHGTYWHNNRQPMSHGCVNLLTRSGMVRQSAERHARDRSPSGPASSFPIPDPVSRPIHGILKRLRLVGRCAYLHVSHHPARCPRHGSAAVGAIRRSTRSHSCAAATAGAGPTTRWPWAACCRCAGAAPTAQARLPHAGRGVRGRSWHGPCSARRSCRCW